jgi:predicted O-linked N-acetylglucosamine transferase (SPINDLY family)
MFDIWMRLLRAVDESVLWLHKTNDRMVVNLRRAAEERNVDPARLIFAEGKDLSEHLARHRLADLFLDTTPYSAGATASAALWAGVPVLTVLGRTFIGRMAASMLHAVGLPELVTNDLAEYEALALKLATDAALLDSIRAKLSRNRLTYPLFNTDRFRRHLEMALQEMWVRYKMGQRPSSFAVT